MITIVSNIKEVQRNFNRAQGAIMRANVKTVKGITKAGQRFARSIAPSATGDLKEGIIIRPVKRKGKVVSSALISKVNKRFPYQKWVNEDIKTVTLPIRRTRFGSWPRASTRKSNPRKWTRKFTYRQTDHTGTPGYFNLTIKEMQKKILPVAKANLKTELKAVFTK